MIRKVYIWAKTALRDQLEGIRQDSAQDVILVNDFYRKKPKIRERANMVGLNKLSNAVGLFVPEMHPAVSTWVR